MVSGVSDSKRHSSLFSGTWAMDTLPFEVRKVDVRNGALSTSSTLAPFCAAEIEQAEPARPEPMTMMSACTGSVAPDAPSCFLDSGFGLHPVSASDPPSTIAPMTNCLLVNVLPIALSSRRQAAEPPRTLRTIRRRKERTIARKDVTSNRTKRAMGV